MTARLGEASKRVIEGDRDVMSTVTDCMKSLVQFYPKHIEKEDKHFLSLVWSILLKQSDRLF